MKRVLISILSILLTICLSGCSWTNHNIKRYMSSGREIDEFAKDALPDLDNLPEYEDIYYQYYTDRDIPSTDTMLLVVIYDEDTYEAEKARLDKTYTFLDHVARDSHSDSIVMPEYEFYINTYDFRVLEAILYPHYFGMIATSDENKSIAYLYFYNQSLDYVAESMEDFVKEYFPYCW